MSLRGAAIPDILPRMAVSRAGGKLEAAIARFGLARDRARARARSTSARRRAASPRRCSRTAPRSVLAVDVGHGQLHPSLRADPRVTSLEGVDWQRLSLDVAEGPFDFFTVDVSFVAARNMLRGARVPAAPRRRGRRAGQAAVRAPRPAGRRRPARTPRTCATRRSRRCASAREALGFALVEHFDSPVAGGSGTVEVLAHLRFGGPARRRCPQPGERKPRRAAPRAARGRARRPRRCAGSPSSRPAWRRSRARRDRGAARRLGDRAPRPAASTGPAPPASGYRANLWSARRDARAGARRRGRGARVRQAAPPRRRASPGARSSPPGATVAARASASRCRLYHTGALAEAAVLAVADAVPGARAAKTRRGRPT